MEKYKLDKKKAITIISCIALAATLNGCLTPKKEKNIKNENIETVSKLETTDETKETEEKDTLEEYIVYLNEEIKEVESYASDKWNSEECIQKREDIKEKLKTLIDFVFNGKEINGITFKELKTEEKEKILLELTKLDDKIDEYIPEYKERFKDWFAEKSSDIKEWIVDRSADLREIWEDYKSEVDEEYRSRKLWEILQNKVSFLFAICKKK